MCGLVALWDVTASTPGPELHRACKRMRDTLVHRGPDDADAWVDEAQGIALGHRRLSIVDLSPTGRQPMASPSGRWQVAFNGEIYNVGELRDALPGVRWRGHSDTEVLCAALDVWGLPDTLTRLVGMFAIAAWDTKTRKLWLARDRLGQKPLYWTRAGSHVLVGSELRALRVHPACPTRIDRRALVDVIGRFAVTQPRTMLHGVSQVPPGGLVALGTGSTDIGAYWDARDHVRRGSAPDLAEAVDRVESALTRSVTLRAVADVPVGALLSGGIDSSLITALLVHAGHDVRTFTIGVDDPAFDESGPAARIAEYLGTDHTTLPLRQRDLQDLVPRLVHLQDEPFADISLLPTALVCRLARQHVTVALAGDGGDELFGGYARYGRALRLWDLVRRSPRPVRAAANAAVRRAYRRHARGQLSALPPTVVGALRRAMQATAPDLAAIYRSVSASTLAPEAYVLGTDGTPRPTLPIDNVEAVRRLMLEDLLVYMPSDVLTKGDRASMASSLELRAPLLDHHVAEAALALPAELTWADGLGKRVLRELLARHVPKALWDRPKQGFGVPIAEWLRGPLRDWMETQLSERRLSDSGLWNVPAIRQRWSEHLAGAQQQVLLWGVAQVQAWLDEDPGNGPSAAW